MMSRLSVMGALVMDEAGTPVRLRGVNLGGWMLLEGFINGFPGTESMMRDALNKAVGAEHTTHLLDSIRANFYGADDARFLGSLGINVVRIPVNYRHFESDDQPFELRTGAFVELDRVIELNDANGMYSVIDLHAAQGYQNHAWHSDNPTHLPMLWTHRLFQDRVAWLWGQFAEHYAGDPRVAGFNLLNEPADPTGAALANLHRRLVQEIRSIDPDRIVILDGNTYSRDFDAFGEPIENAIYSMHQYPDPGAAGAAPYPGSYAGRTWDRAAVEEEFLQRSTYMRRHGLPVWVSEFGPVYDGHPEVDAGRARLLDDQISVYDEHGAGWALWTYKDVGTLGLMSLDADGPWRSAVDEMTSKTSRLGAVSFSVPEANARKAYGQVFDLVGSDVHADGWYPFGPAWEVWNVVGEKLIAHFLLREWAERFCDLDTARLDELAESFRFEACTARQSIADTIRRSSDRFPATGR